MTYKPKGEPYGFILFPARFGEAWGEIDDSQCLFIYYSDFEYLLVHIRNVFPLKDPETKETLEFDLCGMNWIYKGAWEKIISEIKAAPQSDILLQDFLNHFCKWVLDNLEWADGIMIEGTL